MKEKKCEYVRCDRTFFPITRRKYCSDKCAHKESSRKHYIRKHNLNEVLCVPVKCRNEKCDKEFIKYDRKRLFCNRKCMRSYHNNKNKGSDKEFWREHYQCQKVAKFLKQIGMPTTHQERAWGMKAPLKIEVIESVKGLENGMFTQEEYEQELQVLSKEHEFDYNKLKDYAENLEIKHVTVQYGQNSKGEDALSDFRRGDDDFLPQGPTQAALEPLLSS